MTVKQWFGRKLRPVRAGFVNVVSMQRAFRTLPESLQVDSPAFIANGRIPVRYTASSRELFPPLRWANVPPHCKEMVLVVEDGDSPTWSPIVHAIAYGIDPSTGLLHEGALPGQSHADGTPPSRELQPGKNSMGGLGWLGPAPVVGHGVHHYYFQLFALNARLEFRGDPTRADVVAAMQGRVLARGMCMATYERS